MSLLILLLRCLFAILLHMLSADYYFADTLIFRYHYFDAASICALSTRHITIDAAAIFRR